jgi:hypothetical protein
MVGALYQDVNVSEGLEQIITAWNFSKFGMVVAICVITCLMGMMIPGSSVVVIFGPVFITTLASVGVDPLLVAAMLFGLLAGQFSLALAVLGTLLLGGLLYAFGGRRTELGRQLSCEVLGLRHYLRTVPKAELQYICNQNPDYFYDLVPYALALGADKAFAARFGKRALAPCPYLKIRGAEAHSAQAFMQQARQVLQAMDARRRQLPAEKLIALLRSFTK